MNVIDQATEEFIRAVQQSDTYLEYKRLLETVRQTPELKAQIDEFRRRNFLLQTDREIDFDKLDRFEREFESFRANPLVADFLAAELALCRAMQESHQRVVESLDFH